MILINGNWEQVNDIHDVSRVIREYYNEELANRIDEINIEPEHSDDDYWALEVELGDREDEINQLEDELSYKKNQIEDLKEEIEDLNKEISDLKDKIEELEGE